MIRRPSRQTDLSTVLVRGVLRAAPVGVGHPDRRAGPGCRRRRRWAASPRGSAARAAAGPRSAPASGRRGAPQGWPGSRRVAANAPSPWGRISTTPKPAASRWRPQRRQDGVGLGAHHEAELAGRAGAARDGVDRRLGHAGRHREDREGVPAVGALGRGVRPGSPQAGSIARAVPALHRQAAQRLPHEPGVRAVGAPFRDANRAGARRRSRRARGPGSAPGPRGGRPSCPSDGRPRAAPPTRSKASAPRAPHEERGRAGLQARAVRGDQDVRRQPLALRAEEVGEAGGAGLLGGLDHQLEVEPEPPRARPARPPSARRLIRCWPLLSAVPRP